MLPIMTGRKGVSRFLGGRKGEGEGGRGNTIQADGAAARRVGDDVGADLGIGQRADGKQRAGEEEGGSVAGGRVGRSQEHAVAGNNEGRADDHDDLAAVPAPAEQRQEDGEEAADDVGGHGVQLLDDGRLFGVDGADDGRGEEGEALDRDVVEHVDDRGGEGDGVEDAREELLLVHLVENLGGRDALGLDAGNGELALLGGEPSRGLGAVGEGEEAGGRAKVSIL